MGKDLSFVPLRPELVVEVRYEHMEGDRFRHTAQFNRWRPDRDPRTCTYEQLEEPVRYNLTDIFRTGLRGTDGLTNRLDRPAHLGHRSTDHADRQLHRTSRSLVELVRPLDQLREHQARDRRVSDRA